MGWSTWCGPSMASWTSWSTMQGWLPRTILTTLQSISALKKWAGSSRLMLGELVLLLRLFLPLLRKSPTPRVLAISSFLGSISKNLPSESNFYMATSYRCSKSALNQLIKCFSLDIPEVTFLVVSPGHVQTDMGNASGRTAPLTVDTAASNIVSLARTCDKNMSGTFLDHEGLEIPY